MKKSKATDSAMWFVIAAQFVGGNGYPVCLIGGPIAWCRGWITGTTTLWLLGAGVVFYIMSSKAYMTIVHYGEEMEEAR